MIMAGTNIQSSTDDLRKVPEDYLYNSLIHPKPAIESRIRQLRIVYQLNQKQYARQKRLLPYFVCGNFNPPYRRKENFAYTESFILDIDNLSSKMLDIEDLRKQLQADPRILMCFTSPSEDGLKIMFKFKERCFDAGIYSIFYKEFAKHFSEHYHLNQVIDSVTSDVSRACFASMDSNVFYNPNCEPIDIKAVIDLNNTDQLFGLKASQDKNTKEADQQSRKEHQEFHLGEPEGAIMAKIKQCLNPNGKNVRKVERQVYVPEQLEEMIDDLKKYIEATGLIVSEIINIQYGKKIRIKMGLKQAEINLFFGRRGFTVVKSPRCGTDEELNQITADLIQNYILTLPL